jgi:hypothetical protein
VSEDNGDNLEVKKGQVTEKMSREAFHQRFAARFYDPAFRHEDESVARLEAIAWDAYAQGRKSPVTEKAGPGFANPDYDLSVEWRDAKQRIRAAQQTQQDRATRSRILIVNASARNDFTCPGEMSKSFRLAKRIESIVRSARFDADFLDLSLLVSRRFARDGCSGPMRRWSRRAPNEAACRASRRAWACHMLSSKGTQHVQRSNE